MAISKQRKNEVLDQYKDWLAKSQAVILVEYTGATMKNMDAVSFALMRGEKECAQIIANKITKGNEANVISLLNEADEIAELNAYGKKA